MRLQEGSVFDFTELRARCDQALRVGKEELMAPAQQVKEKASKVDTALVHLEAMRNRVRGIRDALAMGKEVEGME
jgi:hypothetical protein